MKKTGLSFQQPDRQAGADNQTFALKLMYFWVYCSAGSWLGFFNLFLQERGFSGREIGMIMGAQQALLFLTVLVWGILADRFGIKRIFALVSFLAVLAIRVIPQQSGFIAMFTTMILWSFVSHPLGTLSDSITVAYIKNSGRSTFASIRVWGSAGWATASLGVGMYLKMHPVSETFSIAFVAYLALFLVILFAVREPVAVENRGKLAWHELRLLLQNKPLILLLSILLLYGICITPINLFINLYFTELGGDYRLVGLAFGLNAVAEIPLFFLAIPLVKKFGPLRVIIFSMLVTTARLAIYGQLNNPVHALFLSGLNGFSFSIFWVATVEFVHQIVPPAWRATGQALLWAFHIGFGITLGNVLVGYFSDLAGMRWVMTFAAGLSLIVLALLYFYILRFDFEKSG